MIFVTLGSQKFQFNRLLQKIDELVSHGVLKEEVFAQIGYSDYKPQCYQYQQFMDRNSFADKIRNSNIVITHGGSGAIIGAVKAKKKVIAIPRLAKYGEHVDNHQLQLVKEFKDMGIIEACYNLDFLEESYKQIKNREFEMYKSNTSKIIENIESFLMGVERKNG